MSDIYDDGLVRVEANMSPERLAEVLTMFGDAEFIDEAPEPGTGGHRARRKARREAERKARKHSR